MDDWYSLDRAEEILTRFKNFAVVGCSDDPRRASYGVTTFLKDSGYEVVPINPNCPECQGMTSYPDLASVPGYFEVEVVDLFRRSEFVSAHVDEAIEKGAKAIWMQLGVVDEQAAKRAEDAGLLVVMDRCPAQDLPRLAG